MLGDSLRTMHVRCCPHEFVLKKFARRVSFQMQSSGRNVFLLLLSLQGVESTHKLFDWYQLDV